MFFWVTRAQRKHLALGGLGRELVRKVADVGAEVGRGSTWGGPARGRRDWTGFQLAFEVRGE